MALIWDLTKIPNHQEQCWTPALNADGTQQHDSAGKPLWDLKPVTNALIWSSIAVGLREITTANYIEWYARMRVGDALAGSTVLLGPDGPRPITLDEVRAHIGLATNVTPETRRKWGQRQIQYQLEEEMAAAARTAAVWDAAERAAAQPRATVTDGRLVVDDTAPEGA